MKFPSGKKQKILSMIICSILVLAIPVSNQASSIISDLQNETNELENQISSINDDIRKLGEDLEGFNQQIELTESEIQRTEDELEIAIENQEKRYEEMKVRIQYMYENGEESLLELIFEAESIVDMVNKSEFVSSVMTYDQEQIEELAKIQKEIEESKDTLEAEKLALEELKEVSEEKQVELEKQVAKTSQTLESVQAQLAAEKQKQAEKERKEREQARTNPQGTVGDSDFEYEASASELDVFAAILDCEAGANYNSRLAVATVIMNRVESSRFPNTVKDVIYAKGQFSPVWTGKLDKTLAKGPSQLSYQVAKEALAGARLEEVSHCYYFLYAGSTNRAGVNVGGNLFFASW